MVSCSHIEQSIFACSMVKMLVDLIAVTATVFVVSYDVIECNQR